MTPDIREQEPSLLGGFKGNDLHSKLEQEFEILFNLKNRDYKAYITYVLQKKGKLEEKSLDIRIPNIPTPTECGTGVYAHFAKCTGSQPNRTIKGLKDYYHNKKLAKFFTKQIQLILKDTLPKYMNKLIKI